LKTRNLRRRKVFHFLPKRMSRIFSSQIEKYTGMKIAAMETPE
jgi:hypothetical protein